MIITDFSRLATKQPYGHTQRRNAMATSSFFHGRGLLPARHPRSAIAAGKNHHATMKWGVVRLMAAARPASLRRRIRSFFSTDELAFFTLVGRRHGRVARRFCFLKRLVDNLWLSKSYAHVLPCQVNVFLKIICWASDLGCPGRRHGYGLLILPAQGCLDTPDLWITERRDYNCGCSKLTISTSGWRLLCTCIQDKNRHERGVCVWSK